jgi:2-(1,2-epoxy-1,2-dihydrophenyl)acetyl-CoA isomerase
MTDTVLETRDGAVVTFTLNRPERLNATVPEMTAYLRERLPCIAEDGSVGALILTGAGRGFCAGGDVQTMANRGEIPLAERTAMLRRNAEISRVLSEMPQVTVCAVNGVAAGAGLSLALSCDLRIAAESARFTTAFVKMGLCTDLGGAYFLRRLVGTAKAKELFLMGDILPAAEALRLGLVSRVVPDADLPAEAAAVAKRLAEGPRVAHGYLKRVLHAAETDTLAEWLDLEAWAQASCAMTADHKEATRAFAEKRPPRFEGR